MLCTQHHTIHTQQFLKVLSVIVGGFLFTLLTTAWSVLGIRKLITTIGTTGTTTTANSSSSSNSVVASDTSSSTDGSSYSVDDDNIVSLSNGAAINKSVNVRGVANSVITNIIDTGRQPPPKTFSKALFRTLKLLAYVSGIFTVTLMKYTPTSKYVHPLRSTFLLFTTLSTFVFGTNLPKSFTKIVHPLVTCTSLTWLMD